MSPGRILGAALLTLLAAPAVVPATGAQPSEAAWVLPDPAGDVALWVADQKMPAAPPSAGNVPYVDLARLSIWDDDLEHIRFQIKNGMGFKPMAPGNFFLGADQLYHIISFELPGNLSSGVRGILQVISYGYDVKLATATVVTVPEVGYVAFCLSQSASSFSCPFETRRFVPWRIEQGEVIASVPKLWLTRAAAGAARIQPAFLPEQLWAGDELRGIVLRSVAGPGTSVSSFVQGTTGPRFEDRAPDAGPAPAYRLAHPSLATDITLEATQTAVLAGQENRVKVQVTNHAGGKRLLNLSASVRDIQEPASWAATVPPSIVLGAGRSANFTLRVTAPAAKDGLDATAVVHLEASAVGENEVVAALNLPLVATAPLDAGRSTFFVHGTRNASAIDVLPLDFTNFQRGFLSRVDPDPRALDDKAVPFAPQVGATSTTWRVSLVSRDGIPNPALLRAGEAAQARLVIHSPIELQVRLEWLLRAADQILVQQVVDRTVRQGANRFELSAPILPEATRLDPSMGAVRADVAMHMEGPHSFPVGLVTIFEGPELGARDSFFKVPLDREEVVERPENLPAIELVAAEDTEAFVNPGSTVVFEMDVRNPDPEAARVEILTQASDPNWTVTVEPGRRLILGPDDSVRLGIVVGSPSMGAEGSALAVRVVARHVDSGADLASLPLRAVLTRGVPVENESFEPRPEDARRLETEPPAESPGPGALVVVAAAGAAILRGRSRRARSDGWR